MTGDDLITILNPGQYSTIQDEGRIGHRAYAIPQGGCLDGYAQRLANYLVGNGPSTAVVEAIGHFSFEVLSATSVGVVGADVVVELNGERQEVSRTIHLSVGEQVDVKGKLVCMAIRGGFWGKGHFGSVSTYPLAKLGGMNGEPLQKGDVLRAESESDLKLNRAMNKDLFPRESSVIRIIRGPEFEGNEEEFESRQWTISTSSNRMGLRLIGGSWNMDSTEIDSVPVFPGTIQLPKNGEPIVLMKDAQTTGGYPRTGQVIKADMSRLGRMILGGTIRFKFVTIEEARHIFNRQETFIKHALRI
jgi:antagonist of KipI